MALRIQVRAPSRLHFGLLSFGNPNGPEFGGAGVMVSKPSLEMHAAKTNASFQATGRLTDRVEGFARTWAEFYSLPWPLSCCIHVESSPPQHAGLGAGTQLALSVAASLVSLNGMQRPSPAELAQSVGRGARSAVGTYGFSRGGLIVERGKMPGQSIGELDCRLELPSAWRFVVIQPDVPGGLHGASEKGAFAALPPVAAETRRQLEAELRERTIPAAAAGDCEAFGESLYQYGRRAGDCFADVQGGSYNGPLLTEMVASVRAMGVPGVGQSSWGPTLYALCPDDGAAQSLVEQFQERWTDQAKLVVAPVDNVGALITVAESS